MWLGVYKTLRKWPVNTFPHKPWFLRVYSTSLLKTPWEKEKLLVTSNFFFSHSVFYPFGELQPFSLNVKLSSANSFSLEESKNLSFGKGLKTWWEIADNQHFCLLGSRSAQDELLWSITVRCPSVHPFMNIYLKYPLLWNRQIPMKLHRNDP